MVHPVVPKLIEVQTVVTISSHSSPTPGEATYTKTETKWGLGLHEATVVVTPIKSHMTKFVHVQEQTACTHRKSTLAICVMCGNK